MRGRIQKNDALRRGLSPQQLERAERAGVIIDPPDNIANNEMLAAIWDYVVDSTPTLTKADTPQIMMLVLWYGVYFAAADMLTNEDGVFDYSPESSKAPINDMKKASSEIRLLCQELGVSPLARERLGLINATTAKTAAETAAMFLSFDDLAAFYPELEAGAE